MASDPTSVDHPKSPWIEPKFLMAAGVVGLIAVLGLLLAFTGGSKGGAQTPARTPALPAAPTEQGTASACGLAAGSQEIPQIAPKATWKLLGTVAVPNAPSTFGPQKTAGGVPSCFAHSPTGALFAMVNIDAAMGVFARQAGRYPVDKVLRMIAAGPGREVLKRAVAQASAITRGDKTPAAQLAGFNIVRYELANAVVDVAFAGDHPDSAGYVHGQATMRWEGGDWKLVLAQNGAPFDSVQPIADLTGYIPWSGI